MTDIALYQPVRGPRRYRLYEVEMDRAGFERHNTLLNHLTTREGLEPLDTFSDPVNGKEGVRLHRFYLPEKVCDEYERRIKDGR